MKTSEQVFNLVHKYEAVERYREEMKWVLHAFDMAERSESFRELFLIVGKDENEGRG